MHLTLFCRVQTAANDGARVLSADITGILEYSKRPLLPSPSTSSSFTFKPSHVTTPTSITLEQAVGMSDVVISAVPGGKFKVQTSWLKDGVVCVDVAGEKNFEADVATKVSCLSARIYLRLRMRRRRIRTQRD